LRAETAAEGLQRKAMQAEELAAAFTSVSAGEVLGGLQIGTDVGLASRGLAIDQQWRELRRRPQK